MDMPENTPDNDTNHAVFARLGESLRQAVIGQQTLVSRLLIALLADGHLLVEGAPGLAKTTAVKALAARLQVAFHRVQFTPDLLPADLTGTDIWRPQEGCFQFQPGPLFHSLLLADEINRAPAKVQSALLEAMGERQVTVGAQTYALPRMFMVMATQNPIEQEGTYPLPEAQLDRFLMHVRVGYPDASMEAEILRLVHRQATAESEAGSASPAPAQAGLLDEGQVLSARREVLALHVAEPVQRYIVEIVLASRDATIYDAELGGRIAWGASPRGTIALDRCARAHAWLRGQQFVTPEDVQAVAPDVLRHRVLPSYEAQAEGWDGGRLVTRLLELVPAP